MTPLPDGFVPALLDWYAQNARPLPWREDASPYRVWVSEIMLQQTRIEAARGYFLRFMEALPGVEALAAATEDEVLKLWEGLGYYSRARNLRRAAKLVVAEYGGRLPGDYAALRKLPGIGDYTAGAIASIAFGLPEPAVDGNVLRVLSRLVASMENVGDAQVKREFRAALRAVYPPGRCGAFTEALMELGEVCCTPGTPGCLTCPLAGLCRAWAGGIQAGLPVMPAKKARRIEARTVFLFVSEGRVALRKRPGNGLLAGLWEFPNVPGALAEGEALAQAAAWGLAPRDAAGCLPAVHIFTHIEWHMTGYVIDCAAPGGDFVWATRDELRETYALPTAFRFLEKNLGKAL